MDLRCYGLATPRNDDKVSIHLQDLGDFHQEWDLESLPWNAVTPVQPGDEHPEELDLRLVAALNEGPLKGLGDAQKDVRGACTAFLYLYMNLSRSLDQYVSFSLSTLRGACCPLSVVARSYLLIN